MVTGAADQNANVIFGAVIDEKHGDEVRVTVIATGFGSPRTRRRRAISTTTPALEPSPRRESTRERFDAPEEIEIPSFLRDDA